MTDPRRAKIAEAMEAIENGWHKESHVGPSGVRRYIEVSSRALPLASAMIDELTKAREHYGIHIYDLKVTAEAAGDNLDKGFVREKALKARIDELTAEVEGLGSEVGRFEAALAYVVHAVQDYLAGADNRLSESIRPYTGSDGALLSRRTRKAEARVKELTAEVERHKAEKLHLIRQLQSIARHSAEHGTKSRVSVALSEVNYD